MDDLKRPRQRLHMEFQIFKVSGTRQIQNLGNIVGKEAFHAWVYLLYLPRFEFVLRISPPPR